MTVQRTFIENDPVSKHMQKIRSTLLVILMMTAALAGCISEDTSDLDAQIEDLDTQNTELTQTIAERDLSISDLEATIAGLESNVAGLEASITLMEEQRDALLALLSDSQEFANQTLELAEAMNETIAALHVMLGENATQTTAPAMTADRCPYTNGNRLPRAIALSFGIDRWMMISRVLIL